MRKIPALIWYSAGAAFIAIVVFQFFFLPTVDQTKPLAKSNAPNAATAVVHTAETSFKERPNPAKQQTSLNETQGISSVDAVLKRLPPTPLELELPMDATEEDQKNFAKRHGLHLLVRVLAMQRVRDIFNREDAIRKSAESLWEGMAIPQLIEQMGEPHGVTTGDDPREVNPTTSARAWKLKPGEVPFRNAFVLSWDRQSATPFSKLNLAGHRIELLYSSHPFATKHQPFGSPSYKVLYLSIDERGMLTKTEWVECCAGMD